MKKLLCVIALAALSGIALQAQNLTGSWQGTLKTPTNQELRLVVKVSLVDDKLKAVFYSIDQKSPPIPATTFTKDGSAFRSERHV